MSQLALRFEAFENSDLQHEAAVYMIRIGSVYYIGSTGNLRSRILTHVRHLNKANHSAKLLQHAYEALTNRIEISVVKKYKQYGSGYSLLQYEAKLIKLMSSKGYTVANTQHYKNPSSLLII